MTLAIERKRLIDFPLYLSLWIKAVILFCFSKKLLMNTLLLLIEITKSGKKHLSEQIIIQINLTG
ncbi:hypothetical protein CH54_1558 [Yersinia rochesterensis]|uniref:Uncharacterized protein n=2 Tax=Yersinia rochesterensis TaxID=1604335 RepID=A0A386HBW9_9GAMM|nr:hypothetical protein DJ57_2410 [Yersinia rochesterensis]AJI88897.1 hypothetical protein AW19_105 [Yersinia frederiksenii Y225]CNH06531.1 Uncharacterised protein [Yersinia kristensenii]AJJ34049.1 hypothetical protein CH54_1558 [Yersinia rochesterensis]AYD43136.1 hypothetical protein DXZ79_04965 [Yersinia rochesterensis]